MPAAAAGAEGEQEEAGPRTRRRVAAAAREPATPARRGGKRALKTEVSSPGPLAKGPAPSKRARAEPAAAGQKADAEQPGPTEEEALLLDSRGVPAAARERLLRLLRRWGPERAAQVLALWAFVGDGGARPTCAGCLQAWGPAGTGKTAVVQDFLEVMGVQHVRVNCGSLVSVGELHSSIVEELWRLAGEREAGRAGGLLLRGLDKLDAALRQPLERLARPAGSAEEEPPSGESRVVVVLDNAHELPRLGPNAVELLTRLSEVLQSGSQLTVLAVGRLPLSHLGLPVDRDPPAVAFGPYAPQEAEAVLLRELGKQREGGEAPPAGLAAVLTGLMKFAVPHVGCNLQMLLAIGEDLLREAPEAREERSTPASLKSLQGHVDRSLQKRTGLCDLAGFLPPGDSSIGDRDNGIGAALTATLRCMTNAEKRMLVAAYIAAYTDRNDDEVLFLSECRRKQRRRGPGRKKKKGEDDGRPFYTHAPRPVPFARFLAISHRLSRLAGSREAQSLNSVFFEHLMSLRESRLLRLSGDRHAGADTRDPKVLCCAELSLVKACALELSIDLAEYLL